MLGSLADLSKRNTAAGHRLVQTQYTHRLGQTKVSFINPKVVSS